MRFYKSFYKSLSFRVFYNSFYRLFPGWELLRAIYKISSWYYQYRSTWDDRISRSRITSSRRITQRGKRRVKFSLGNVNAEKKKRERRGSKKGWFHGFVRWKSYAQGMPRGLIRKRLDWFDSKANNATSRAWWNSEGYGRD